MIPPKSCCFTKKPVFASQGFVILCPVHTTIYFNIGTVHYKACFVDVLNTVELVNGMYIFFYAYF